MKTLRRMLSVQYLTILNRMKDYKKTFVLQERTLNPITGLVRTGRRINSLLAQEPSQELNLLQWSLSGKVAKVRAKVAKEVAKERVAFKAIVGTVGNRGIEHPSAGVRPAERGANWDSQAPKAAKTKVGEKP